MDRPGLIATLVLTPVLLAISTGAAAQEFIARGVASPAITREAVEAVRYSLASLAGLGAALDPPPKVYFAGTKADCEDVHVELGRTRSEGQRRCSLFTGMAFQGALILNLQYIAELHRDPAAFMWWVVPHEMFHLYQWQTGVFQMPVAFQEGSADLHKLKVLHERRLINAVAYVHQHLVPAAKAGRARWNISIMPRSVLLTALNKDAHYALWAVMGHYLSLNGGWPKIIELNGPGRTPFPERFQGLYGKALDEFGQEFFAWLDRQ
ncbi:MAG: hypothetical protein QN131_09050 [Armatimonadota bacterium]|nr:hypothetical protein [Armatimonadota bacterium]MDR7550066.1 hypothetical protein [Armatimonadota bacterium]